MPEVFQLFDSTIYSCPAHEFVLANSKTQTRIPLHENQINKEENKSLQLTDDNDKRIHPFPS